jgi:small subunit ribosomal protein S14
MIAREKKRSLLVTKYKERRTALKRLVSTPTISIEERQRAIHSLQKLPRDSSASRRRNRCMLCGRARGNYRRTNLCRIHMRYQVNNGFVPGMSKASW